MKPAKADDGGGGEALIDGATLHAAAQADPTGTAGLAVVLIGAVTGVVSGVALAVRRRLRSSHEA